jgi:flagellar basal-body rod protein FlgF/flagellar basal-body rod protein FlgG
MSRTQALDTAANNLANAGTNGFRAQRDYFRGIFAGGLDRENPADSQVSESVNGFGVLGGNRLDMGQGQVATTGNPLDLALEGQGFFALQTQNGISYTRDGAFSRSSTGVLQSSLGEPVLDINHQPITIPTGTIHVAADGSISVSTTDGNVIVGQVGVFDFTDKSNLIANGANRLSAGNTKPTAGKALVQQGAIEGANQDAIHGTMQLVLVQRQAEMMQKALSVFNNEFDKTAAEELPRV